MLITVQYCLQTWFQESNSIMEVWLAINQRLTVLKINITWPITDSHIKEYYFIH